MAHLRGLRLKAGEARVLGDAPVHSNWPDVNKHNKAGGARRARAGCFSSSVEQAYARARLPGLHNLH